MGLPGDSFTSDIENEIFCSSGLSWVRVESHRITPSWLRQALRRIAELWRSHCWDKNLFCSWHSQQVQAWMNRLSFTALTEQGKSIRSLNAFRELLNISVKACFLWLGMRYPAIPCWMGNAHFLSSYHSLRNISLELCVIIIIFSFGRMRWLRSEFCADWVITSPINSVIDPLLPSKSSPVLFQQANPHTDVLNLTSLSQAQVFSTFSYIRTSYFIWSMRQGGESQLCKASASARSYLSCWMSNSSRVRIK